MEGRFFKDNLSVLGDVGIGTTNPLYKLDVVETGSVASSRIRSTNANIARLFLSNTVGTWRLYSAAASNSFRIFSDSLNDDTFVIDSSGYVGIGTTDPRGPLEVHAASDSTLVIERFTSNGIQLRADNSADSAIRLGFEAYTYEFKNGSGTSRLHIDANGKVGIGITSPSEKLDVVGKGRFTDGVIVPETTNGGFEYRTNSAWGGWARDAFTIANGTGGNFFSLGGYGGNGTTLTYGYIGKSYTDYCIRFYLDGGVDLTHNDVIKLSTTSTGVTVTGDLRVTGAYYASDNNAGSSNQVLTSTGSGGTDWKSLSDIGDTVTGSGTTNYVTKWSNGANSDLTNSLIYDNGTNVGISTASPSAKLHVHSTTGILHTGDNYSSWVLKYLSNQGSGSAVINYYLIAAKTQTNVRFDGVLKGARQVGTSATGSGGARITFYTNNAGTPLATGGLESWATDSYGHPIFKLVELTYNSVEYYAIEISPSTSWSAGFAHVQFEGIANNVLFTNLGTASVSGVTEFSGEESVFSYKYGNLGIGTDGPEGKLHIFTGNSGGSVNSSADELVIESESTGGIQFLNGSTASGYILFGDSGGNSTGQIRYLHSDDSMRVTTANVERLIINSSGKVGVGTTNPECKLDIHDHTSATTFIADNNAGVRITNWGGSTGWSLLGFGGSSSAYSRNLSQIGSLSANSGTYLAFGTSNNYSTGITNQAMTIDPSGNVGIGTTGPNSRLDVRSTSAFTNGVAYVEQGLATNLPTLLVNQTVSGGNQNADQGLVVKAVGTSDGSGNTLHVYQRDGSTTGLVVKGSGNVGIGTASPDGVLHLASTASSVQRLIFSNSNANLNPQQRIEFWEGTGTGTAANANCAIEYDGTGTYQSSDGILLIKGSGSSVDLPIAGFNRNGNVYLGMSGIARVGIGTTNPSRKLHVNGTIKAGIAGNSSANTPALLVASAGTSPQQSAIAIQQDTTEGDTIIFADYEPYVEYGINTDNGSDTIEFTAGTSTNNLGSKTLYNQSGNARTAYKKVIISLTSGNMSVGGNVGIGTESPAAKLNVVGDVLVNTGYSLFTDAVDEARYNETTGEGGIAVDAFNFNGSNGGPNIQIANNYSRGWANIYTNKIDAGSDVTDANNRHLSMYTDGARAWDLNINSADDLAILNVQSGNLLLDPTGAGNVGIGTDSPNDKLEIHGNMRVRGSDGFGAGSTANYNPSYVAYPGGGKIGSSSSSQAGYVKITLPQSWTNTMMQFSVDIFEYQVNKAKTFVLAGYNYAPSGGSWHNTSAMVLAADDGATYKVEFGHDGSKCAIYISKGTSGASSSWTYPYVVVRDASFGFTSTGISNWIDGWSVSFSTATLSGITQTRDISTQVTGTGTSQYITKWNATGTEINDSVIAQNVSNIGIGIANAQRLVTLYKASTPVLQLVNSTTGAGSSDGFLLTQGGLNTTIENSEAGYMAFRTTADEKMRIDASGNVGIGTASPTANLTVLGVTGTTIIQALGADSNGFADVEIKSTGTTGASRLFFSDTAAQSGFIKYNHSDNSMQFGTSASVRMHIDTSGNVGIGTDNPGHVFTVHKSSGAVNTPIAWIHNSGNFANYDGTVISCVNDGSDAEVLHVRTNNTTYNGGTSLMLVRGDGHVGIGNTNPQGTLDLGNATGGKSIVWGGSSGTNHYTSIWSEYGTASLVLAGGLKSSTSSADFIYPYTGTYGYAAIELDSFHDDGIKFYTAADAARTAGAVATKQERMRIDTSGNVGIGTADPNQKLHVSGGSTNLPVIRLQRNDTSVVPDDLIGGFENYSNDADGAFISSYIKGYATETYGRQGYLTFGTAGTNSTDASEKMRIKADGNVGIGTTNPGAKLHVSAGAIIGDSTQQATTLTIRATNTAGSPAATAKILMEGYEGRGIGTFYTDSTYSGEEWFCGMNYSGNFNSWNIGYDQAGGEAEYLANTLFQLHHNGKLQLHAYGAGTFTGTATKRLAVDASGNVIEIAGGIIDGSGTADYVARWTDTDTLGIGKIRDDNSTVAINTAPDSNYMLKVGGNGYFSGTLTEASSLAIKENIENFTPSIDKINKIRPVKYNKKGSDKKEIGLIAEELEELFPELVEKDENGNPSGVNYSRAVTVLLGGFKELYKELQEIKKRI